MFPALYSSTHITRERPLLGLILLLYAAFSLHGVITHTPWRDEAYVWLMARDLSYVQLLQELRYNASPGLWHHLVMLLAKAGLPYESMHMLHWLVACAAAAVFLYCAPFGLTIRALFLFSYYMAYEHAVVARVYGIGLLLLFASCALFAKRSERPYAYAACVALLANTNLLGLMAAAMFGAHYAFELLKAKHYTPARLLPAALMLFGGLFAAWCVYPPKDALYYYTQTMPFMRPFKIIDGIHHAFQPIPFYQRFHTLGIGLYIGAPIIVLAAFLLAQRRAWFGLVFLVVCYGWLSYIVVFRYLYPSPRHYGYYLFYLLAALWLAARQRPPVSHRPEKVLAILLVLSLSMGLSASFFSQLAAHRNIRLSGSAPMAAYLKEHWPENAVLIGYRNAVAATVLPFLPGREIWYLENRKSGTYIHFTDGSRRPLHHPSIPSIANTQLPGANRLYLFCNKAPPRRKFSVIHAEMSGTREWFYLAKERALPEVKSALSQ